MTDAVAAAPAFEAQSLAASLTVADLNRSVAWYRDVLGFKVEREYSPRGRVIAVALSAGSVEILLNQDDGAQGERVKGQGFSLQFTTAQDVDALAAAIQSRGGVLDTPPTDFAGRRAFRFHDPDGFKFVFSSPRK